MTTETLNTYAVLFPDLRDEVAETLDGMLAEVVDISRATSVLRQEGNGKAVWPGKSRLLF